MSVDHYENFPVASILLPARLRPPVEAIYAFARSADDIADEGDASADQRLASLQGYAAQLDRIEAGQSVESALFVRLAQMVAAHALPLQPMRDLLSAPFGRERIARGADPAGGFSSPGSDPPCHPTIAT